VIDDARTTPAQDLARLMDGFLTTQLLYVAARLGLADLLAGGPRGAEELAAEAGADPARLRRVLRGLALEGVVAEQDGGRFALTPVGALLRSDVPGSLRAQAIMRGGIYYRAAAELLGAVTDGATPFVTAHGEPFFAFLAAHDQHGADFDAAMAGRAAHEADDVVAAYAFADLRRVVDVGSGHGVLVAALLRAAPEAEAVLFDRAPAIAQARHALQRDGLAERCSFVVGDFFASVPAGGDAYVLSRILHDWEDADALRILAACRAAMDDTARLLIVDAILPERARDQPAAIRTDLHMLVLVGARERTVAEFRDLLGRAGFAVRRVVPTGSPIGLRIVEAVPADAFPRDRPSARLRSGRS
jgi:hypothetical protein